MSDDKPPTVGIQLEQCEDGRIQAEIHGFDKGIEARESKRLEITKTTIDGRPSDNSQQPKNNGSNRAKEWYEKPIGMIAIGVAVLVLGALVILVLKHVFPSLGF